MYRVLRNNKWYHVLWKISSYRKLSLKLSKWYRAAINWNFWKGQNDCNLLLYLNLINKKVIGAFKLKKNMLIPRRYQYRSQPESGKPVEGCIGIYVISHKVDVWTVSVMNTFWICLFKLHFSLFYLLARKRPKSLGTTTVFGRKSLSAKAFCWKGLLKMDFLQLIFEGKCGAGYTGDLAIDDVIILPGWCDYDGSGVEV